MELSNTNDIASLVQTKPNKNQLMLDMEAAKKKPHIEFVPLSDKEIAAIIRPELNIEKFSNFLFPHRKAK